MAGAGRPTRDHREPRGVAPSGRRGVCWARTGWSWLLSLVLITFGLLIPVEREAFAQASLSEEAERIAKAGFRGGEVGYILFDLANRGILSHRNVDRAYIPASVMKVPTALAALHILGPEYQPLTSLYVDGAVRGNRIVGDLYLVGGGDPMLNADHLLRVIGQLVDQGIQQVDGRFYYDESLFESRRELNTRQPNVVSYNPGLSALSVNFNRVWLKWGHKPRQGLETSLLAIADTDRTAVDWIQAGAAPRSAPGSLLYDEPTQGTERWLVTHRARKVGGTWVPVKHSGYNTAMLFRSLAADNGILLSKPHKRKKPRRAALLARLHGEPMKEILRKLLKYSNNLAAEMVGLLTARHVLRRRVNEEDANALLDSWLTQRLDALDWSKAVIVSHSGLSAEARLTPLQMASILVHAQETRYDDEEFFEILPEPKWAKRARKQRRNRLKAELRAKSGTMAYASGLGGYILTEGGRALGFTIFISDIPARQRYDARMQPWDVKIDAKASRWIHRAKALEKTLVRYWADAYSKSPI